MGKSMGQEIKVENLVVAFGGLRALDGVGVTFADDQITGLIGPNGSGKSTLVNTISGQIRAAEGIIRLGGQMVSGLRTDRLVRRGLARTYQIPLMPPQLTVEEVISVPLTYGRGRDFLLPGLGDAVSVARFCGLGGFIGKICGQLSVTDLRRLEIARAIACGPSVLLLDEVMAGLSHEDSADVVGLVRRIHAGGVAVVVVEHVMRIITSLCHRVVVLNQGRLLAEGAPADVLADEGVREAYLGRGFVSA
jgi:branched-chain amino acid transport system ATP-binding protein